MDDNKFSYTYSAETKEELARIRRKYISQEETTLEKVKKLDNSVTEKATIFSISLGTISTLVLGVGMCCCLVWTQLFVLGIIIGLLGIAGICSAFPAYKYILKREREKIAPQILALTDEEMKRNSN